MSVRFPDDIIPKEKSDSIKSDKLKHNMNK